MHPKKIRKRSVSKKRKNKQVGAAALYPNKSIKNDFEAVEKSSNYDESVLK